MTNELKLVKIDVHYCDYLRRYDNKVPYNEGTKELRPFIGVLFKVNSFLYFAPLSSPRTKHLKLKDNIDFLRIDEGRLGAINFNNMLPVHEKNIIEIHLNKEESSIDLKYQKLLKKQLFWLNRNRNKLYRKSKYLYKSYVNKTLNDNVVKRCCDFLLLEKKSLEYNK